MALYMVSRWAVVQEIEVGRGDIAEDGRLEPNAVDRCHEVARVAYVRGCDRLASAIGSDLLTLRSIAKRRRVSNASCRGSLLVAASVTEVRASSFDMAIRVRSCADGDVVLDDVITFALVDPRTGRALAIPPDIRAALIATEKSAREYC